jgi:hypothetical protein
MKYRIVVAALGVVVAIQMLCIGPAAADDEPVLVSDPTKFELTVDKTEGTTSVTVINPSPKSLRLKTLPIDDAQVQCEAKPFTNEVVAHTQKAITVTFTGCSHAMTSSGRFTIAKEGAPPRDYLFVPVSASQKAEPDVPWKHMVWFLYCGAGGFVVLLAAYVLWLFTAKKPKKGQPEEKKRTWPSPVFPLGGLDSSWTFKESLGKQRDRDSGGVHRRARCN